MPRTVMTAGVEARRPTTYTRVPMLAVWNGRRLEVTVDGKHAGITEFAPRRNRLILTTSIGDRSFYRHVGGMTSRYANRVLADTLIVRTALHNASDLHANFDVLYALRYLLQMYERILTIDDTILISSKCPDLFEMVPPSALGAVYDSGERDWVKYMQISCLHYGIARSLCPRRAVNCGLLLLSRSAHLRMLLDLDSTRHLLVSLRVVHGIGLWLNQPWWNTRIAKYNVSVFDLPARFNMVGTQYAHATDEERRSACVLHMTKYIDLPRHGLEFGTFGRGREGCAAMMNAGDLAGDQMLCRDTEADMRPRHHPQDNSSNSTVLAAVLAASSPLKEFPREPQPEADTVYSSSSPPRAAQKGRICEESGALSRIWPLCTKCICCRPPCVASHCWRCSPCCLRSPTGCRRPAAAAGRPPASA